MLNTKLFVFKNIFSKGGNEPYASLQSDRREDCAAGRDTGCGCGGHDLEHHDRRDIFVDRRVSCVIDDRHKK
ncbi:hypothetical protein STSP2_03379 [Anaerohalosphaera lusitana]|uniref:Uncharacterized protein n=1 Tax=Anaerohalosphaera lusitana TaxID=1936003 RepID=A0A1U9NQZ9_9BACT|nr:hypothetical protein STSP2_03379 [Anaerohalosphaera lusitana]